MSELDETDVIGHCGRDFTRADLQIIRATLQEFSWLSRVELARTLCEKLGWFTASGGYKVDACLKLLEKLTVLGLMELPEKYLFGTRRRQAVKPVRAREETSPPIEISGTLADVGPASLELALAPEDRRAWKEAVDRYHYLGYKRPFGCSLAYFITSSRGRLGCVLLAGAAKSMGARDRWIGWTAQQRLRSLPWVVNNTRFLIFPWVHVKHLASHVLGQVARRIRQDWRARFGYQPVLLETFVDPSRYQGTCYRAAGWVELGCTTGEGLIRPGCTYRTTPKVILVQPLQADARQLLCSDSLEGRVFDE